MAEEYRDYHSALLRRSMEISSQAITAGSTAFGALLAGKDGVAPLGRVDVEISVSSCTGHAVHEGCRS
ncbi:hypothetical protein ACFOLF_01330 [Paenibacillus sepulcri]|uniref:Uncharacterized protein n=1 Tax=Paenibacillus sepulcri TaxID=359917 RepID=A0ABS7CBQ9_9BACL|nr:hypothetical protein [Paenibacillus sepulcri]